MSFKIVAPPRVFQGSPETSALDLAAAWLAEQCAGGFEPLAVLAVGGAPRVVLCGGEPGSPIVFRKRGTK
jgi:hypothetical protein